MVQKKLIYFPSFSAGAYGNSAKKNDKMRNGLSCRFYSTDFPQEFRHPYFLWPAGHFYKKTNVNEQWGFLDNPEIKLFGDSGGFQIASGAIKWDVKIRHQIMEWLEENSTISMNLDIPPRLKYEGKVQECMDLSVENIKYFHENRTGKTKFLNVIQGNDEYSYLEWYKAVKDYEFEGWSIGGAGGSIYRFFSGIMAFLSGKEHLKKTNEYFHVLGTSKIIDFFLLVQLQKSLNDVGSTVQITTDSSSPNISTKFGRLYTSFDLKRASFTNVHLPKLNLEKSQESSEVIYNKPELILDNNFKLPKITESQKWLDQCYEYDDIKNMTSNGYVAMVLNNLFVFKNAIEQIEYFVNGEPYIFEQIVSRDTYILCHILDLMVKSDDPIKTFNKYKQTIINNSNLTQLNTSTTHNFF